MLNLNAVASPGRTDSSGGHSCNKNCDNYNSLRVVQLTVAGQFFAM